ncbi:hypothetical protein Trydic_g6802 [Trypoxylus dichotomus]
MYPELAQWLSEVLFTRTTEVGEQTTTINTTYGTPQGGACSPLIWNLVVDRLLNKLTVFGVHCIGYADHIAIIVKGKFEGILCELIQMNLRITNEWCHSVGLIKNHDCTFH